MKRLGVAIRWPVIRGAALRGRAAIRIAAFAAAVACVAFALPTTSDDAYHATTPAGYDVIQLQPSGALVSILGLFECPQLKGAQRLNQGLESQIVLSDGAKLDRFPSQFSVRVTASLRKALMEEPEFTVKTDKAPGDFLLGLRFRLQAYDGLDHHVILPRSVTMIGAPATLPYYERIYRLNFNVGDRPITSRFLLEVFSPKGEQIGRFSFRLL